MSCPSHGMNDISVGGCLGFRLNAENCSHCWKCLDALLRTAPEGLFGSGEAALLTA